MSAIEKSALYKKSYGAWAGFPKGNAPDYSLCCSEVWGRERWPRCYQCHKKRGHGPDGAYCKQHDPAVEKARKAAADQRDKDKWNKLRYEIHAHTFFDALLKIAEGHNDARGLAQDVINTFKEGAR